jgi:hypothetical protein
MEKKVKCTKNTKQGINDNKIIPYSSLTANEIQSPWWGLEADHVK